MKYFFEHGLRFQCQRCGKCCTGEPGTVYVAQDEIVSIAEFLNIKVAQVKKDYLYPFRDSYSIKELMDGSCVFYKNNGCLIYSVRPRQCKTYPFWLKNLRNQNKWLEVAKECPGVGKGRVYSLEEILRIIDISPI